MPSVPAYTGPGNSAGYLNPLRGVKGLIPERIDQGVDYGLPAGEVAPVYALGPGRITQVGIGQGTGWAGAPEAGVNPGGYVGEQLSAGPAKGQYVYVAEGITPTVHAGQAVTAKTIIARMSAAIETGFASGVGTQTAAAAAGQPGISTASGASYSRLLRQVGAPAGIPQNPIVGPVQTFKFLPAAKPAPPIMNQAGRGLAQSHISPNTPQLLKPAKSPPVVKFPAPKSRAKPKPRPRAKPRARARPRPSIAALVAYIRPASRRPAPRRPAYRPVPRRGPGHPLLH